MRPLKFQGTGIRMKITIPIRQEVSMRRSVVFLLAATLILASCILSGAGQGNPGYNPQGRRDNPQNQTRMGDRRSFVGPLSLELVRQAEYLSQSSYEYFMGWNGTITNPEQAMLFKSEEFTAACRLFSKLVQDQTGYFGRDSIRTNSTAPSATSPSHSVSSRNRCASAAYATISPGSGATAGGLSSARTAARRGASDWPNAAASSTGLRSSSRPGAEPGCARQRDVYDYSPRWELRLG
jgi:hypothetical protein